MWTDLGAAIALMLVIEGVFPFLSPGALRARLQQLAELNDRHLRVLGLLSMSVGVVLLYLLK